MFQNSRRQSDRPTTRRPQLNRRPLVEDLEGRQLQSGLTPIWGQHIGSVAESIQGNHIGVVAESIQGNHIGMAVPGGGGVGRHIG
jgi:hypothetical protein